MPGPGGLTPWTLSSATRALEPPSRRRAATPTPRPFELDADHGVATSADDRRDDGRRAGINHVVAGDQVELGTGPGPPARCRSSPWNAVEVPTVPEINASSWALLPMPPFADARGQTQPSARGRRRRRPAALRLSDNQRASRCRWRQRLQRTADKLDADEWFRGAARSRRRVSHRRRYRRRHHHGTGGPEGRRPYRREVQTFCDEGGRPIPGLLGMHRRPENRIGLGPARYHPAIRARGDRRRGGRVQGDASTAICPPTSAPHGLRRVHRAAGRPRALVRSVGVELADDRDSAGEANGQVHGSTAWARSR